MIRKIIIVTILLSLVYSCNKQENIITINRESIKNWEKLNIENLNNCCEGFKKSLVGLIVYRNFKNNVRSRVLEKISLKGERNFIEFFEEYSNKDNMFSIIVNNGKVKSYSYKHLKDSIILKKDIYNILGRGSVKEVKNIFLNSNLKCCDYEGISHPSIIIYSKMEVDKNGEIKVLKTVTR